MNRTNLAFPFSIIILVFLAVTCAPFPVTATVATTSLPVTATPQAIAWKKIIGKYVTFECPPTWNPTPAPLFGGSVLEDWRLGISNVESDQDLGFSAVSSQQGRPNDIVSEKQITIGGKTGFKWIRSGNNYVSYNYITTGQNNQGSFSVHVTVAQADSALEAMLDRLVQSIVFNQ
jgi:hypothetical protein